MSGDRQRYQSARPKNIRQAHFRHPYAHHIRMLPSAVARLAAEIDLVHGARVIDYGCADVPYRTFFPAHVEYLPADLPGNPQATIVLRDDGTLPVDDETIDAVVSTQVLEHVSDPGLYLSECYRVLRPGGRLLLSTHGIFMYHPDPQDLWRWTCEGLQKVITDAGFEVEQFEGVIGLGATGLQLLQDAISFRLPRRLVPYLAIVMQPLVTLVDRLGSAERRQYNAQVFALVAVKR